MTLCAAFGGGQAAILDGVCARRSGGSQVGTKEWPSQSNKGIGLGRGSIGPWGGSSDHRLSSASFGSFFVRLSAVSPSRPASRRTRAATAVKDGRRPPPEAARSVLDSRCRSRHTGGRSGGEIGGTMLRETNEYQGQPVPVPHTGYGAERSQRCAIIRLMEYAATLRSSMRSSVRFKGTSIGSRRPSSGWG